MSPPQNDKLMRPLALKICTVWSEHKIRSNPRNPQSKHDLRKLKYDKNKLRKALKQLGFQNGDYDVRLLDGPYLTLMHDFCFSVKKGGENENWELEELFEEIYQITKKEGRFKAADLKDLAPFNLSASSEFLQNVFNETGKELGAQGAWRMLPIFLLTGIDPSRRQESNGRLFFAEELRDQLAAFMQRFLDVDNGRDFATCEFHLEEAKGNNPPNEVWRGDVVAHNFSFEPKDFKVFHKGEQLLAGQIGFKEVRLGINVGLNQTKKQPGGNPVISLDVTLGPTTHAELPPLSMPGQILLPKTEHQFGEARGVWSFKAIKTITKRKNSQTIEEEKPGSQPTNVRFCDNNPGKPTVWGRLLVTRSESDELDEEIDGDQLSIGQTLSSTQLLYASQSDMQIAVSEDDDGRTEEDKDPDEMARALALKKYLAKPLTKQLECEHQDVMLLASQILKVDL